MDKYFSWYEVQAIELSTELVQLAEWQPLYRLICEQLKQDHRACTTLGAQIAKSLINIAATRIFANSSQSILELPVNSVDAYLTRQGVAGVGKFGMGFFSVLYWLIDHPQRVLGIVNRGRDNYICHIQERDDQLQYKLDIIPTTPDGVSLTIILDCLDDPFTQTEIDNFTQQLQKLRFINDVQVIVNGKIINANWLRTERLPSVNVNLNKYKIVVNDNATGIPLEVLRQNLLVPSSSTKTIAASLTNQSLVEQDKTGMFIDRQQSYSTLSILVANIAVVDLTVQKGNISFIIDMQRQVAVPVSRDDILINNDHYMQIFEDKIGKVAILALDEGHINLYIYLLKRYAKQTTQQRIKDSISKLKKFILQYAIDNNYIVYHSSSSQTFKALVKQYQFKDFKFRSYDDYDVDVLEKQLNKLDIWRNDLYMTKLVTIVDTMPEPADNLNTSHYLVVNSSIDDWYRQLPMIYTRDRLISVISQTNITDNKIKSLIDQLQIQDQAVYVDIYNLCLKVLSLITYFEPEGEKDFYEVNEVFLKIFTDWLKMYDADFIRSLIQQIYLNLDHSLPSKFIYGQQMYTFRFIHAMPLTTDFVDDCLENIKKLPDDFQYYLLDFFENNMSWNRKKFIELMTWKVETTPLTTLLHQFNTDWLKSLIIFSSLWEAYGDFNYPHWGLLELSPLYLYLMTANTANIVSSWLRSNFDILLSICDNVWHYYTIFEVLLIFQLSLYNNGQIKLTMTEYRQYANYVLHELRDHYTITQLRGWWLFMITNNDWEAIAVNLIEPLLRLLYVFWNYQKETAVMPIFSIISQNVNHHYRFLASDCIQYVFNHEVSLNNLENLYHILSQSGSGQPVQNLQILEIAINEGTTKDPIQASITELVQNAVDAVRQSGKTGIIDINISNTDSSLQTALSISDPVGMQTNNILALFIPFLSTKTPSQLVTGQLGSGFFNVYRQAQTVIIDTTYDQVRTIIQDVPILRNGRVIDLQRTVDIYEGRNNCTTITLILSAIDLEHKLQTIAHIVNYVHSIIAYTLVEGIQINLNKYPLQPQIRKIDMPDSNAYSAYEAIPISAEVNPNNKELLDAIGHDKKRHIGQPFNSLLLTNGIPFMPLRDYLINNNLLPSFLINNISDNVLINLPSDKYQAVQSRTHIILTEENELSLRQYLLKVVYCHLLQRIVDNDAMASQWLPNFKSYSSINQLWFSNSEAIALDQCRSTAELVTNGDYLRNRESIALRINYLWGEGMQDPDSILGQFSLGTALPTPEILREYAHNTSLIPLAKQVLLLWLGSKNQDIITNQRLASEPLQYQWSDEEIDELNIFTQSWVRLFWYLGGNLNLADTYFDGQAPLVNWSSFIDNRSTLGQYDITRHQIELNLTAIKPSLFTAIDNFKNGQWELLLDNKQWNNVFGIQYPASTLVHEMEHAWRRSEHQALHNDWLVLDSEGEMKLDFETAANYVYQKIIESGFYNQLKEAL